MKTRILYILTAAVLLAGCFDSVSYKTRYVLKPLVQEASGDPYNALLGVQAFVYAADTTLWTVASYEDALNGIITSKTNPSDRQTTPLAVATAYEELGTEWWLQLPVGGPSLMIVAVDTEHKLYAYTQQAFVENMTEGLYVSLVFKLWKTGKSYIDGKWYFFNDFYTPPTSVTSYIDPKVQREEGGADEALADNMVYTYAYAADTTAWYIASYADAVSGIITSKTEPVTQRTNPSFKAYKDSATGLYAMTVSSETLMVVVVDKADQIYAYSKQTVDIQAAPVTFSITLRPWKNVTLYEEDGWRVVDESATPEEPTDPEEPEEPTDPETARNRNR